MSYPTPSAAIKLVYSLLRDRSELNLVALYNDEEADTAAEGIMYYVASPGTNSGLTDGSRDYIDPLIAVIAFGPDLTIAEGWNRVIAGALEAVSGASAYGEVVRMAQERPYHSSAKRPDKSVRHMVGGLYRTHIVPV